MSDPNPLGFDLLVKYGRRQKVLSNMCNTTSRQEFTERMESWIGNEFPRHYTAFFYDKNSAKMIQLDDNQSCYLGPVFDLISTRNKGVGAQTPSHNDGSNIELFISADDSSAPCPLSEAFAGNVVISILYKLISH